MKVCTNTASCQQKEWAIGVGIKLTFPDGGPSPDQVGGLLAVDGVITRHTVRVNNREISAMTAAGKHPGIIIQ